MRDYLIRRFLLLIPTLLGISFIAFMITRVVPGGPVEQAMTQARQAAMKGGIRGAGGNDALSPEQVQQLKKMYGLDRPVLLAYLEWLGLKPKPVTEDDGKEVWKFAGVLQGNFGVSFREGEPVTAVIGRRLLISATFGLLTTLIVYSTCIPLGILKAMKHRSPFDNASSVGIFVGYAIPGYVLATVLMYLFCFKWQVFPNSGFQSEGFEKLGAFAQLSDRFQHMFLPLVCYLVGSFAFMTMLMKNQLLDNLAMDYVRTAVAKGVGYRDAVLKHAFRNSLVPLATNLGNLISVIFMGSFLIEKIFDIDGLGLLGYSSVVDRDYPVMLAILFIGSLFMLIGNILSDICVAFVDPRIRFGK